MRDTEIDVLERNQLGHIARHHGWGLVWRTDGLVDLQKEDTRHEEVPRQLAHGLMLKNGYKPPFD